MGLPTVCLYFLTFLKFNGLFFYFSSLSLISITCIILTILSGPDLLNVSDIGGCLILYLFHFSSVVNVNLNFTLQVSEFEL